MKVEVKKKSFLDALKAMKKMPKGAKGNMFSNYVIISAANNIIELRITDVCESASVILKDESIIEQGSVAVPYQQLFTLVKGWNKDTIEFSLQGDDIILKGENSIGSIKCKDSGGFIARYNGECDKTMKLSTFIEAVKSIEYATKSKSFSPVLNGMYMRQKGDKIVFVGTDSFRLAELVVDGNIGDFECIIPIAALKSFLPALEYANNCGCEFMKFGKSDKHITIDLPLGRNTITLVSEFIVGQYPNYDREEVIPRSYDCVVEMDRSELLQAMSDVLFMAKDNNNVVKVVLEDGKILLTSGKTENGEASIYVSGTVRGEPISYDINGKYLIDFLKHEQAGTISMYLLPKYKPIRFTGSRGDAYQYVLRPVV